MASVLIKWRDVNAPDVTNQYRIYRSTSPMDTANLPAPLVEGLAKSTTQYEDTTVTPGTTYYYIVASYTATTESLGEEQMMFAGPNVYLSYSDNVNKMSRDSTKPAFSASDLSESGGIVSMEVDNAGNIYTGDSQGSIHKFDAYGVHQWSAATIFTYVIGLAIDGDGNVYCGGYGATGIQKYDSLGTLVTTYDPTFVSSSYRNVVDITIDAQNNIVFVGGDNNVDPTGVGGAKMDQAGGEIWTFSYTTSSNHRVHSVITDPDLNTYISHSYDHPSSSTSDNNYIRKIDPGGTTLWSTGLGYYAHAPRARRTIAYNPVNGYIYYAWRSSNQYRGGKIDPVDGTDLGTITGISFAHNVACDHLGNVYFMYSDKVTMYDSSDVQVTTWTCAETSHEDAIACDPGRYAVNNNLIV